MQRKKEMNRAVDPHHQYILIGLRWKEKNILLEICPTSNVQTNSVDNYENHPINEFYKDNLNICINTDNKTVSNISLTEEYIKLHNTFNFSINDFKNMNINEIKSSFLNEEEKNELINKL